MSLARARDLPIRTALSGPAAGVVGAVEIAASAGRPDVVTLDMGGTSADVALIRGGRAAIGFDRQVADFPIRLPMVDIHTVGRAAARSPGSTRTGSSQGRPAERRRPARPGLLRPGRPGADRDRRQSGARPPRAARAARRPDGARPRCGARGDGAAARRLGFTLERTAHGLLGVVAANMVRAIRTISVERGHDPRRFTLMPFGGAAAARARGREALGIRRILVPAAPGILCAQGLVVSDLKEDFVAGQRLPVEPAAEARSGARSTSCGSRRRPGSTRGRAAGRPHARAQLDLRYVGQNFGTAVPFDVAALPDPAGLRAASSRPMRPPMATTTRTIGGGGELPPDRARTSLPGAAARASRRPGAAAAAGRAARGLVRPGGAAAPVYERATLEAGQRLRGSGGHRAARRHHPVFPCDHATVDPRATSIELEP